MPLLQRHILNSAFFFWMGESEGEMWRGDVCVCMWGGGGLCRWIIIMDKESMINKYTYMYDGLKQ